MTAFCTACGKAIEPGAQFCLRCGAPAAARDGSEHSRRPRFRASRRALWALAAIAAIMLASAAWWLRSYLGPPAAVVGVWSGAVAALPPDAGPYANASSVDITISRIGQGGSLIGTVTVGGASSPISGRIRGHHISIVADFSALSVGGPHPRFIADGTVDGDSIETRTTFTNGGTDTSAVVLIDAAVTLLRTKLKPAPAVSSPVAAASGVPFSELKPELREPLDGTVYHHYPRIVDMRWDPIPAAVRYKVEVEFDNSLDHSWRWAPLWIRDSVANNLRISFVGAQWGRWRVWAIDAGGETSQTSRWSAFLFTR